MLSINFFGVLISSLLKKYLAKTTTSITKFYEPITLFKNLRQPIRVMHMGEG